jgi:hypothetical protein
MSMNASSQREEIPSLYQQLDKSQIRKDFRMPTW